MKCKIHLLNIKSIQARSQDIYVLQVTLLGNANNNINTDQLNYYKKSTSRW